MTEEHKNQLLFFVGYEIKSSLWCKFISWEYAQKIAAKYFVWKTKRKYFRYLKYTTNELDKTK